MRKTDYIPIAMVSLLAGFIGFQIARAPRRTVATPPVATETPATKPPETATVVAARTAAGRPPGDVDGLLQMSASAPPARDVEDIRRRLRIGASGTYIEEALKQLDSALYRWEDPLVIPIRIWVAQAPDPNGDELTRLARDAFGDWTATGIPARFSFVVDRADADVTVEWIEKFDSGNRLGHTKVVYDQYRWLKPGAVITLATHYPTGEVVRSSLVRGIAVHEVGHLLGLPHSADSADVMFPRLYTERMSRQDMATIRLVYSVPAGSIK